MYARSGTNVTDARHIHAPHTRVIYTSDSHTSVTNESLTLRFAKRGRALLRAFPDVAALFGRGGAEPPHKLGLRWLRGSEKAARRSTDLCRCSRWRRLPLPGRRSQSARRNLRGLLSEKHSGAR